MALPKITPEQQAKALEAAKVARAKTAAAKADLKAGKITLAELLNTEDKTLKRMKVKAVLTCMSGVGAKTAENIMEQFEIDPNRRISGLGSRQKDALLQRFGQ